MPQPVKSQEEFVAEMKGEMLENSSHFYLIQVHAGAKVCIKVGITLQPQVELRRWKFTDKKGNELAHHVLCFFPDIIPKFGSGSCSPLKHKAATLESVVKKALTNELGEHSKLVYEKGTCSNEVFECSPAVALRAVALAMSHSVRFDHGKGSSYLHKKHKEDGVAGIHLLPPDTFGKSESVVAQAKQEPLPGTKLLETWGFVC